MNAVRKVFVFLALSLGALTTHAAVTGSASIQVDWSSALIGGVGATPSSYVDSSDGYATVSSYTYGDTAPFTESLDYFYTNNGAAFEVDTGPGPVQVVAGFASAGQYAAADISSAGDGFSSAQAWNGTGYIYQASGSGQLSFEIDYTLAGSAVIGSGSEYLGANYEVYLYMWDADLFASDFESLYASNGGDYAAAYRQANSNAFITDDYFTGTLLNCSTPGTCSASQSGTFTTTPLTFNVQAGTNYGMEVYILMSGESYSTVVPLPASAWMFGAAILGLALVSRRRTWSSSVG